MGKRGTTRKTHKRQPAHSSKKSGPPPPKVSIPTSIVRDFRGLLEGRRKPEGDPGGPSIRSDISLDLVNLFEADVTTGIGPFLAVYLASSRHLTPAQIGIAMSAPGIAVLLSQAPAGALVDATKRKRMLLALASMTIGLGSIAITIAPGLAGIVAAQIMIAIAGAIVPILVAAISLGLVGRARLSRRIGRNEAFNHAGNVLGAILAGTVGHIAQAGVFYMAAVMSGLTAVSAMSIREREIDHQLAREAKGDNNEDTPLASFLDLFTHWRLMVFALAVLLFQAGNASILPLVGQVFAKGSNAGDSALYMSWAILVSQTVMIPIAILAGYFCAEYGRKPTMLLAFVTLPVYALACTLTTAPLGLIGVQILGGITSGILTVVAIQMVNDLGRGSGRFNLMEGVIFTSMSVGPSIGNLLAGYVAGRAGFNAAFFTVAAIGGLALAIFAIFMPETQR